MKKIKRINKKVDIEIHPDGDIYVGNGKVWKYVGFIVDEDTQHQIPVYNPVAEKFYKLLKKC